MSRGSSASFEDTVRNLLRMKSHPHKETGDEPKPATGSRSEDQRADPDQQKDGAKPG